MTSTLATRSTFNDAKVVNFVSGGNPIALYDVSEVRISEWRGNAAGEVPAREFRGNFDTVDPVTVKSLASGNRRPNEKGMLLPSQSM